MLNNTKGFTLMEILVVVTIIGILAAIAVPSYIYAVEKGREDACASHVQMLTTQVERYRLEKGMSIPDCDDIVDFLQDAGYLVNQTVKCPFADVYDEVVVYKYEGGKVKCTHLDKKDD